MLAGRCWKGVSSLGRALILFAEVDPLLLLMGVLELVVEEPELYFFFHMSKKISSSNFWYSHLVDLLL